MRGESANSENRGRHLGATAVDEGPHLAVDDGEAVPPVPVPPPPLQPHWPEKLSRDCGRKECAPPALTPDHDAKRPRPATWCNDTCESLDRFSGWNSG